MLIYQSNIVPKWIIKGYDNYIIANDNNIYNIKTRRKLKMQLKGYTKGYYLNGKFLSLSQIRKITTKYVDEDCPF